ncbi:uncharacterized protein LOC127793918 isoform X2 [Diospyros lotus]|uniref:uncharacterized protein LOC127793918 isoform X2 n=1 Tax=Diospyros lotus TaxID=55363 RepID=UPI0022532CFC|nr:uncharacterized protein LOC127793918 isoform X2 [Diospyros lotus]
MAETPKLLDMGSDAPGSSCKACGSDEMGAQKICVFDQTNGLHCSCKACESNKRGAQKISVSHQPNGLNFTNFKPDPCIVDVECLSRLPDHDATANSRITLQRSLSRKLSQPPGSEKDGGVIPSSSPKEIAAAVGGAKSPGNDMRATVRTADRPMNAQVHHHIIITTGNAGPIAAENRPGTGSSAKKSSFRRSLPFWAIHFRRIPLYLAALSIAGTLVLIYFTLSVAKHGGDDSALNW